MIMANIKDVAKKANVSISTVSHVLNKTKFVGDELTEKVYSAIKELGYQANEMAASMKRRSTKNIGVILPNIGMVFFPDVLKGIEAAAKEHEYKLFYFSTDYDFEKEKEYISLLRSGWVDGIILDSSCPSDQIEEYQKMLVNSETGKSVPVVTLEAPFTHENLGTIVVDEVKFTEEVIEYLISRGHKDILVLTGPEHIPMYKNNIQGIQNAYQRHGMQLDESQVLHGDYFAQSGYDALSLALKSGKKFTAVFSANDQMAIGAIKALKEAGKSIPDDVAVTGVDGIYVTTLIDPPLTTVELPRYEMGYRAGTLLVEMLNNKECIEKHIAFEGKLLVRKSTDNNAKDDWGLMGW